ncbi:MAG TPA: DUF4153 domain-containing protein [Gemmatimonadota bacterium]|nr:DUF4153 domain-containing protein [Gemmatimonadota bacterium]
MRLPSIDELLRHASDAFRRFPYTISAGLLSALIVIATVEDVDDVFGFLTRSGDGSDLLVATTLALPLFFALRLAEERGLLSGLAAGVARVLGVAGLVAVVWQWPEWSEKLRFLHYVQLSVGLHALAAFVPFVRAGELNGFWQYNRALFLRFLIGALYSVVLFGGLAVALVAIDNLFGLDVAEELYGDLFAVIAFGFHTWFFTAGVPRDLEGLDTVEEYPRGLKLFSQYVLIPLVTVYLAILLAYLAKVLITTEWPSGWIGWLVSCVSVAGILSILLTHPIRHRQENAWIVTYGRWFWLAMIPAVGMLLGAVWKRIDQYGITEPRYFLLLLTLWLAGMAVVYGIVRSQNIKWLPATLCVLAFVTLVGPWSAYAVSRSSQLSRLEGLLARNGMLVDGRAVTEAQAGATPGDTLPTEDRREIGATLVYLFGNHGSEPLAPLLGPELAVTDSLGGTDPVRERVARDRAREVMAALGTAYVEPYPRGLTPGQVYLRADPAEAAETEGYRYVFDGSRNSEVRVAGHLLVVHIVGTAVEFRSGDAVLLTVPLDDLVERATEAAGTAWTGPDDFVPRDIMRVEASSPAIEAVFLPTFVSGTRRGGELTIDAANGLWLMNLNEPAIEAAVDTVAADTAVVSE